MSKLLRAFHSQLYPNASSDSLATLSSAHSSFSELNELEISSEEKFPMKLFSAVELLTLNSYDSTSNVPSSVFSSESFGDGHSFLRVFLAALEEFNAMDEEGVGNSNEDRKAFPKFC